VRYSRIRTLIFHPALAPYRVDLFNELSKRMELKVMFLNRNLVSQKFDQGRLLQSLECEYGFLVSGINFLGRQVRWGVAKAISEFNPDVVIGIEFSPTSLCIALRKRLLPSCRWGLVIMTSDNVSICSNVRLGRRLARRFVLNTADGMIVYTKAVKSWHVKYGMPKESIGVCSNIQKEERFRGLLAEALSTAQRIMHENELAGKRVVLFVGRLVRIKGVDRVIAAFAEASAAFPDSRLVIIGDGPEKARLTAIANDLAPDGKIVFVGQVEGPELHAWYLLGQTLVLASHHESYGAVVVEALLAGMPVLCSSVAGAADLVREGKNGYTFDPHDISALTRKMTKTLETISPLGNGPLTIRESLMPISFDDAVKGFVHAVEYTSRYRVRT